MRYKQGRALLVETHQPDFEALAEYRVAKILQALDPSVEQSKRRVGRPAAAFSKTLRNFFSGLGVNITDKLIIQNHIKYKMSS